MDHLYVTEREPDPQMIMMLADKDERIADLEKLIERAVRHAQKNGMQDWPVFVALRKAINKEGA